MRHKIKKALMIGVLGAAAFAAGGATVASAATGGGGLTGSQDPAVNGTISARAETTAEGADTPASGKAQSDQLRFLAKITATQAQATAAKAAGGTAAAATLGDENGFVVYEVAVTTPKGPVDVKIDAGSGAVLAQDSGENDGEQADETEAPGTETADGTETQDGPQSGPETPDTAPSAGAPATAG